jgi:hypothetical protein
VMFGSLHMVQAILGNLGIGSGFTIYVMLAVTSSKHKLQSAMKMACICMFLRFSVAQIIVQKRTIVMNK